MTVRKVLATAPAPTLAISDDQDAPVQPLVIVTAPDLVTVANVEIIEVGDDWETSTGTFSFTPEDLVSAITSQDDPGVRTPIIKLGHTDTRFNDPEFQASGSMDGQPALGRVENMRLTNNGMTLACDYVGVPRWLAEIMPSAYPRRSFEGEVDLTSSTGNHWPLTVTAVALLGTAYPAINTLEDIQALYGNTAPTLYPVDDEDATEVAAMVSTDKSIKARKVDNVKWKRKTEQTGEVVAASSGVAASASLDDVRSAFYDSLGPGQMYWWIRQVLISPLQLVVDDDMNGLWTIDVSVDASTDTVTFGDPVAVKVEYVAAAKTTNQAPSGQIVAAAFTTAEQAGARVRDTIPDVSTTDEATPEGTEPNGENTTTPEEEQPVKLTPEALTALGLAADATEADISAAIIARGQSTPSGDDGTNTDDATATSATETGSAPATVPAEQITETPPATTVPEGAVVVDQAAWEETQQFIAASRARQAEDTKAENERHIAAAALAGKIPASRLDHYRQLMNTDAEGTKQVLASLAPGLIPVVERGVGAPTSADGSVAAAASAYPDTWKGQVAANARRVGVNTRITNALDKKV